MQPPFLHLHVSSSPPGFSRRSGMWMAAGPRPRPLPQRACKPALIVRYLEGLALAQNTKGICRRSEGEKAVKPALFRHYCPENEIGCSGADGAALPSRVQAAPPRRDSSFTRGRGSAGRRPSEPGSRRVSRRTAGGTTARTDSSSGSRVPRRCPRWSPARHPGRSAARCAPWRAAAGSRGGTRMALATAAEPGEAAAAAAAHQGGAVYELMGEASHSTSTCSRESFSKARQSAISASLS